MRSIILKKVIMFICMSIATAISCSIDGMSLKQLLILTPVAFICGFISLKLANVCYPNEKVN